MSEGPSAETPPTRAEADIRSRRGRRWIIALAVLLAAALGGGGYLVFDLLRTQAELQESERLNEERQRVIDEQKDTIEEQGEMLDEKEEFGAAMEELMSNARALDGIPMASLVPIHDYETLARDAWTERRSPAAVRSLTRTAREDAETLRVLIETGAAERASNATGTLGETLSDQLGAGLVRLVYDGSIVTCGKEAAGCVSTDDPTLIHLNPTEYHAEYYNDAIRTFIVDHEFAHVLQLTNPDPTETALESFGDDLEFMADCYALTATDSWSLDHQVWTDDYSYWDVSVGYGRVCDAAQRDVIRNWLGQVGFRYRSITQSSP